MAETVYHVVAGTASGYIGVRLGIDSSLSGRSVRMGETLHCHDANRDDRVDLEACRRVGAMSMVCVPLGHHGRVIGVLKVYDRPPGAFAPQDVETLGLVPGIIGAHMTHATSFAQQLHDSRHDSLTGPLNRRALEDRLTAQLARAQRHGGQLAVCLLDLDRFKQVNDARGRAAGDCALPASAAHLAQLRDEDGAYRMGGEEFALVLIEASAADTASVLSRLRSTIEQDAACRGVGMSWGTANFEPGDIPGSILARADAALYDAKRRVTA